MEYREKTDKELAALVRHEDNNAIRELTHRYFNGVLRFAARYAGSDKDAADLVQETFFRMWKHIKKYDERRKFSTWLFAIAKNASIDYSRATRRESLFSDIEAAAGFESGSDFFDSIVWSDSREEEARIDRAYGSERVRSAINTLPFPQREIIKRRYDDGLTFTEIAEIMRKPMNTVKSSHGRALKKLSAILDAPET